MARKSKNKPLKKDILIFCEGSTEDLYFNMLNRKYKANKHIELTIYNRKGKQGLTIIRDLINQQKSNPKLNKKNFELVFAVFDKDNLPDHNLTEAFLLAKQHNIFIIFSNECFDLWLLQHYKKITKHMGRDDIYRDISKELNLSKKYTDHKADKDFIENYFFDHVCTAIKNTTMFTDLLTNNVPQNPYTNMHIHLETIYQRSKTSSGW